MWSGEHMFEVRHINMVGDKFMINLDTKECSCRKWMLTGIPCCHAISCMNHINQNPEDYIPLYYRKEAYAACYQSIIFPTNGSNLWPQTEYQNVLPPPFKRQSGRPKKNRNKEASELSKDTTKMSRKGFPIKCGRCGSTGHN